MIHKVNKKPWQKLQNDQIPNKNKNLSKYYKVPSIKNNKISTNKSLKKSIKHFLPYLNIKDIIDQEKVPNHFKS
jgi:hypothetical protein